MSVAITPNGKFIQGGSNATYSVTVSNAVGAGATNATVTVTMTVPPGLTLVSMAGTGWTSNGASCTRADALAAGSSYPAITVTVNVVADANSPQVTGVSVSSGAIKANNQDSTVIEASKSNTDIKSTLKDLGFGVGLGRRWNILKPSIVNDAAVDANGIVRVNTRSNTNAGLMLEMHYFFLKKQSWPKFCSGPFVGVQPGTDQVIQAVGAGWMIGWKVSNDSKERKGFGLGVGYAALPSAKTLGDEFVDGQLAPKGPDGKPLPIRFQQRDKGSVLCMLSFVY